MAFIKKNYRSGHCYYSIVEGYRENGKVKHRTLVYLGRLDNLTEEKRRRIEAAVKGIPPEKRPEIEENLDSLAVCNVKNHGEVDLLYRIAEKLDLRNIINRHVIKGGGVDVGTQMIVLAINRCLDALALQNVGLWYHHTTLEERLGIPFHELSAENLCKAMDYIYEPIRNEEGVVIDAKDNALPIKKEIVEKTKELFGIRLDTLFYDITSTYFEGANCLIARLGYSRDGKRDKKQILVGLVVTKEYRFPVFYNVFEGNTNDMKTVSNTLKVLQGEFKVEKTMLVVDRGMVSPDNLEELDNSGFDTICGLKKSVREVKEIISEAECLEKEEDLVRADISAVELTKEFAGRERKMVVYKSHEKAKEAKECREMKLAKALKELDAYAAKVNAGNYRNVKRVAGKVKELSKGVSKYIKSDITVENGSVRLGIKRRDDRIKEAQWLDGKYLLMCTDLNLTKEEIISAYFDKDGIEKAFRSMKGHGMRPIRHWLLNRVKASIFVGYLALLLLATLGYLLNKAGLGITSEKALNYLKWQKKAVFTAGKTSVEKISLPEIEAKEIMEKLENVNFL
jgi:transposase